jgi:3-oxoacyl-[acyl-carrier protein] reductase
MSDTSLQGRVAVVTGAAQGIGKAYALGLAGAGAHVVVADVKAEAAAATAAACADVGPASLALTVDVSDKASTLAMAEAVRERFGTCHVLVNNAAIYEDLESAPLLEVDIEYWRRVFAVNLDGPLLCVQALAPLMVEAGWGRIVNQSSVGGWMGRGSHYACSKLALSCLTQGLAHQLGRKGVTVNAIAPGTIHTEATMKVVSAELRAQMIARAAVPIEAGPAELVGTLLYLCSDGASFVTGQTIFVDGGAVPRL